MAVLMICSCNSYHFDALWCPLCQLMLQLITVAVDRKLELIVNRCWGVLDVIFMHLLPFY